MASTEIEQTTCGRCGGSGHYSYCSMYGTTCFGCNGSGKKLTKRGAAVMTYLKQLRARRADAFKVGDLLYVEPGPFTGGHFGKVEEIILDSEGLLTIKTPRMAYAGLKPDSMHRPGLTAEEKQRTLKLALAYQDTLTKQGKPKVCQHTTPTEGETEEEL